MTCGYLCACHLGSNSNCKYPACVLTWSGQCAIPVASTWCKHTSASRHWHSLALFPGHLYKEKQPGNLRGFSKLLLPMPEIGSANQNHRKITKIHALKFHSQAPFPSPKQAIPPLPPSLPIANLYKKRCFHGQESPIFSNWNKLSEFLLLIVQWCVIYHLNLQN